MRKRCMPQPDQLRPLMFTIAIRDVLVADGMTASEKLITDEFDLERIDREILMEKVRQDASKLTWEGFNESLRQTLMGKRIVFDAEGRIDIRNAIQYLKRHMPLNGNGNLAAKMKQVAESLECGITVTDVSILLMNSELSISVARTEELVTAVQVKFWDQKAEEWPIRNNLSAEDDLTAFRDSVHSAMLAAKKHVEPQEAGPSNWKVS